MKHLFITSLIFISLLFMQSCDDESSLQYEVDEFGKPALVKVRNQEPLRDGVKTELIGHINSGKRVPIYLVTMPTGESFYWTSYGTLVPTNPVP